MVKFLDPPILIFPSLPRRSARRFKRLARFKPRKNWPEYCLFVTILICVPINLWFWGQSPTASATPKMMVGRLAALTDKIVLGSHSSKIGISMPNSPTATPPGTVEAAGVPAILPPGIGPTGKTNPPAVVLNVAAGTTNNTYAYGQCTWYVAIRRAIPNRWGNANRWYYSAQAAGFKVGASPAVNAIAWTAQGWAGHVALVEQVDGDRVLVAEMNNYGVKGGGWNRVDRRWVQSSEFKYIY